MSQDKTQWHRLLVLLMTPLFKILGYETKAEVDLSIKKQLIDLMVLKKDNEIDWSLLPKEFWEAFDNLKDYNLITFKTYSESLNRGAIEELYGHFTNYLKIEELERDKVNLYAVTQHYPRDLIKPFKKTKYLEVIKENEIIDLKHGALKKIRIIITQSTDNPILALFSNDRDRVYRAYEKIKNETSLFDNISIYLGAISEYYGQEVSNMYTQEDFFRDYPDTPKFVLPWNEKFHDEQLKKIQEEARAAFAEAEAERKAKAKAEQKAEAERKAKETERKAKEAERKAKEAERKAKEAERKAKAKAEQKAETERKAKAKAEQKAEAERKAKELEKQKNKKLSSKLRELGIDPDSLL